MDVTYIIECAQNAHELVSTMSETAAPAAAVVEQMDNKLGAYIGAGLAMFGASGVGAGQGYAAGAAALAVARNPEFKSGIMSTMIIGMAIAESAAIYALIIAVLLIFVA